MSRDSFTRRLRGLTYLPYADRLAFVNLTKLSHRRVITDLILLYKIIHGTIDVKLCDLYLSVNTNNTRANGFRLVLPRPRTNAVKHSFAYRTAFLWNKLPVNVVSAPSLSVFVSRLHNVDFNALF